MTAPRTVSPLFAGDPYRLTLTPSAGSAIIPTPEPIVLKNPGDISDLIVRQPSTAPTNIVNPTLSIPAANPVPQPAVNDGNTGIVPPALVDPVSSTPITDTPKWFQWVKANPIPAAGIAVAVYYIGKEIFKPKKSK